MMPFLKKISLILLIFPIWLIALYWSILFYLSIGIFIFFCLVIIALVFLRKVQPIKSLILVLMVFLIWFTTTCWWILIWFGRWSPILVYSIIIIGLFVCFLILRKIIQQYIWRYLLLNIVYTSISYFTITLVFSMPFYRIYQRITNPYGSIRYYQWNPYESMIFFTILWIVITLIQISFLHFYRMRAIEGKSLEWTLLWDVKFINTKVLYFLKINKKDKLQTSNNKDIDLSSILSQVDISNITSVTFLPKIWQAFIIKTPNIKRLAVYITNKLGKNTFEGEELRKAFDYVVKNISSDLSKRDFDLVTGKIEEFVKSGGDVKINRV